MCVFVCVMTLKTNNEILVSCELFRFQAVKLTWNWHVVLAKEVSVLQSMSDRWIEIGGCNGMDMNVEKLT